MASVTTRPLFLKSLKTEEQVKSKSSLDSRLFREVYIDSLDDADSRSDHVVNDQAPVARLVNTFDQVANAVRLGLLSLEDQRLVLLNAHGSGQRDGAVGHAARQFVRDGFALNLLVENLGRLDLLNRTSAHQPGSESWPQQCLPRGWGRR